MFYCPNEECEHHAIVKILWWDDIELTPYLECSKCKRKLKMIRLDVF